VSLRHGKEDVLKGKHWATIAAATIAAVAGIAVAVITTSKGDDSDGQERRVEVSFPGHEDGVLPHGPAPVILKTSALRNDEFAFVVIQNVRERRWHFSPCAPIDQGADCQKVKFGDGDESVGPCSVVGIVVDSNGKMRILDANVRPIEGALSDVLDGSLLGASPPKTARRDPPTQTVGG
jgi:hypothetical protein